MKNVFRPFTKFKGKFYRIVLRPTMLYRSKFWALKGQQVQEQKIGVTEMRMLG